MDGSATKKLLKYIWDEWHMLFWGIITLVGGNLGQLVIPYYVGMFVDRIVAKKFEEVYTLCWQLVLINLVRKILTIRFIRIPSFSLYGDFKLYET